MTKKNIHIQNIMQNVLNTIGDKLKYLEYQNQRMEIICVWYFFNVPSSLLWKMLIIYDFCTLIQNDFIKPYISHNNLDSKVSASLLSYDTANFIEKNLRKKLFFRNNDSIRIN